jgi:hypothetical protein
MRKVIPLITTGPWASGSAASNSTGAARCATLYMATASADVTVTGSQRKYLSRERSGEPSYVRIEAIRST